MEHSPEGPSHHLFSPIKEKQPRVRRRHKTGLFLPKMKLASDHVFTKERIEIAIANNPAKEAKKWQVSLRQEPRQAKNGEYGLSSVKKTALLAKEHLHSKSQMF